MTTRNTKWMTAIAVLALAPWIIASTADQRSEDDSTIVTIVGTGKAPQEPPFVIVQAGVMSFAKSAAGAMRENAGVIDRIKSDLHRHAIDPKGVRTANLELAPKLDEHDSTKIIGFNARHNLTIVFRDIAKSGAVIDALVASGANQLHGPRFSWEPSDQAAQVARAAAIRDADSRANFYARTLGMKIKRVVTMRDAGGYASGQPDAAMRAAGTEISPGEDTVRVAISAEYELVR
jgi:uncharacterized protein